MPSSSRQAKRPYAGSQPQVQQQPAITAYFQTAPSGSSPFLGKLNPIPHNSAAPPGPPQEQCCRLEVELPALVQSNLLSVGMRVRKAVPEGYKTGKGHDHGRPEVRTGIVVPMRPVAFGVPAGHTIPAVPVEPTGLRGARGERGERYGGTVGRELMPLCGILKVGGLGVQGEGEGKANWAQREREGGVRYDDGELCPWEGEGLPFLSSQGNTISTVSGTSVGISGLKRAYDEDEEDEYEILEATASEWPRVGDIWHDEEELELSPKTRPMRLVGMDTCLGRRVVAVPKSRRKGGAGSGGTKRVEVMEGQENGKVVDFDEAEFLDNGMWNGEVVMRDV